jgi:hypothetical protein
MTETPAESLPPVAPIDGALPEEAVPETAPPELNPPSTETQVGADAPAPSLPTDAGSLSGDLPARS